MDNSREIIDTRTWSKFQFLVSFMLNYYANFPSSQYCEETISSFKTTWFMNLCDCAKNWVALINGLIMDGCVLWQQLQSGVCCLPALGEHEGAGSDDVTHRSCEVADLNIGIAIDLGALNTFLWNIINHIVKHSITYWVRLINATVISVRPSCFTTLDWLLSLPVDLGRRPVASKWDGGRFGLVSGVFMETKMFLSINMK